jgi:hypothetical protein
MMYANESHLVSNLHGFVGRGRTPLHEANLFMEPTSSEARPGCSPSHT